MKSRGNRRRTWLGRLLMALGAGMVGLWLALVVDGLAFQATLGKRLDTLLRASRVRPPVHTAYATRREARATGLIGRLDIPRLGLSALVVEGTSGRALRRGVGHVEHTSFPGERGNVGLAGHRDSYFRPLKDVEKGDVIHLETPDGVFAYEVESILITDRDRADLLHPTGRPQLTLVTCYPFYWVGPAPRRFVVRARATGPSWTAGRETGAAPAADTPF